MAIAELLWNHPDVITAIISIVVSLTAIIYTKYSIGLQREHNRKSMTPLPWIKLGDYDSEIYVILENHGVGPMIILRVSVFKSNDRSIVEKDIFTWMPPLKEPWEDYVSEFKDRSVRPGYEIPMIILKEENFKNGNFKTVRETIRKTLSELTVEIEYTDVYGSPFNSYKRDLKWFDRKMPKEIIAALST